MCALQSRKRLIGCFRYAVQYEQPSPISSGLCRVIRRSGLRTYGPGIPPTHKKRREPFGSLLPCEGACKRGLGSDRKTFRPTGAGNPAPAPIVVTSAYGSVQTVSEPPRAV